VQSKRPSKLAERERQVLSFVFEGLANKQIADRLQVSEVAIRASLQQLFAGTGFRTRSQLVGVALEQYRHNDYCIQPKRCGVELHRKLHLTGSNSIRLHPTLT
jgi:DNA-binding CsgD family transcriptional regulator